MGRQDKKILSEIRGSTNVIDSVAFSDDGKTLTFGDNVGMILLTEVAKPTARSKPLRAHHGDVWSLSFSPDSQLLASGSEDGTVIVLDTVQKRQIGQPLIGGGEPVKRVAFSPDGKLLASGERSNTDTGGVFLWNMDIDAWRQHACQVANRNFSCEEWKTYFSDEAYKPVCSQLPVPACN